jgi:beta-glucosidase
MDIIKDNKCDFLGINYYFRFRIYDNGPDKPFNWPECVNSKEVPGAKFTDMGWEVYPQGLYELVKRIDSVYGNIPLYVMENGAALKDDKYLPDGCVDDDDRISYIKSHLEICSKAIEDGVNLRGYYYWSLMDNFEWTSGYSKKFGLVKVDGNTLKRTIKKSGRWYGEFVGAHQITNS